MVPFTTVRKLSGGLTGGVFGNDLLGDFGGVFGDVFREGFLWVLGGDGVVGGKGCKTDPTGLQVPCAKSRGRLVREAVPVVTDIPRYKQMYTDIHRYTQIYVFAVPLGSLGVSSVGPWGSLWERLGSPGVPWGSPWGV